MARNHLLISHYEGIVDDEEFLLLYDIDTSPNLDLPYDLYERFDFDGLDDDECLSEFRFRKHDLPLLAEVLQIPDKITFRSKRWRPGKGSRTSNKTTQSPSLQSRSKSRSQNRG